MSEAKGGGGNGRKNERREITPCKRLHRTPNRPPQASLIGFNINSILLFHWHAFNDARVSGWNRFNGVVIKVCRQRDFFLSFCSLAENQHVAAKASEHRQRRIKERQEDPFQLRLSVFHPTKPQMKENIILRIATSINGNL